jgi:hypothetical protein
MALYVRLVAASSLTDWLTALGTIGAVIVAVSLQWWISWSEKRRAPVLTLAKDELWKETTSGWPSLRLAVRNASGKRAAEDVQVSVDRVSEANGAITRNLPNISLRWTNLTEGPAVTIPAGASRYVDVGSFIDGPAHGHHAAPVLALATPVGGFRVMQPPVVVDLTVTATNCDARRWHVSITFQPSTVDQLQPENVTLQVKPGHP